jgi:hypothetical protein
MYLMRQRRGHCRKVDAELGLKCLGRKVWVAMSTGVTNRILSAGWDIQAGSSVSSSYAPPQPENRGEPYDATQHSHCWDPPV